MVCKARYSLLEDKLSAIACGGEKDSVNNLVRKTVNDRVGRSQWHIRGVSEPKPDFLWYVELDLPLVRPGGREDPMVLQELRRILNPKLSDQSNSGTRTRTYETEVWGTSHDNAVRKQHS